VVNVNGSSSVWCAYKKITCHSHLTYVRTGDTTGVGYTVIKDVDDPEFNGILPVYISSGDFHYVIQDGDEIVMTFVSDAPFFVDTDSAIGLQGFGFEMIPSVVNMTLTTTNGDMEIYPGPLGRAFESRTITTNSVTIGIVNPEPVVIEAPVTTKNVVTGTSTNGIIWYALVIYTGTLNKQTVYEVEEQSGNAVLGLSKPNTDCADKVYGVTDGHSTRIDNQWGYLGTYQIAQDNDPITIDLLSPTDAGALFDASRHLMFSQFPKYKFTVASNFNSNAKLLLTQKISSATIPLDSIFQLPRETWEIKSGPIIFQPYWNDKNPVKYVTLENATPLYLQLDILNATVGTTFDVVGYYNCADMHYHHYVGRNVPIYEVEEQAMKADLPVEKIPVHRCDGKCNHSNKQNQKEEKEVKPTKPVRVVKEQSGEPLAATRKMEGKPSSGEAVATERRWNFVESFNVDSNVNLINIPVTSALFGKWPFWLVNRFSLWRGRLRLKIMVTNTKNLNGNFHVVHHNYNASEIIATKDFHYILGDIPHAVNGAFGSALELDLDWRNVTPQLPIQPNSNFKNGYVGIAIPIISSTDTTLQHCITIYSDVSELEYRLPRAFSSASGNYQTPAKTLYTREGVQAIKSRQYLMGGSGWKSFKGF